MISPDGKFVGFTAQVDTDSGEEFDSDHPAQWDESFHYSVITWDADQQKITRRNAQPYNGGNPNCFLGDVSLSAGAQVVAMRCGSKLLAVDGLGTYEEIATAVTLNLGQISPNGRYITMDSPAEITGEDLSGNYGVFRYDRTSGSTTLVSMDSAGYALDIIAIKDSGSVGDDGTVAMVHAPGGPNASHVFVFRPQNGFSSNQTVGESSCGGSPSISQSGIILAYDCNGHPTVKNM